MNLTYEYMKKMGWRITGWNIDNPPEIEIAFRQGFLWAAKESLKLPTQKIESRCLELQLKRSNLGFYRKWDDVKHAGLRGKSHGFWYVFEHLDAGGTRESCHPWLEAVEKWANENPPRMDSRYALPPGLRFENALSPRRK
ncbi:MAG: hypothetical protein A2Y12_17145 [Planctomycetes bacterium GWF2_42_9]|nr:MAG: hypothetical protein A2Y12_17145 [Planctomycetes bacterium GWF2_42_9]